MLKTNRLFFKDYDGSIIEVPQKKIFVRTKELKQLKKLDRHGGATVYSQQEPIDIKTLCRNTNYWIRNHRAIGTLKNEEDGVVPYPELADHNQIEERSNESSPEAGINKTAGVLRMKTLLVDQNGDPDDIIPSLPAGMNRNFSVVQPSSSKRSELLHPYSPR